MKVFQQKTEDLVKTLSAHLPTVNFRAGECLFRQGEGDTTLYIVLSGKVSLTTRYDGLADVYEAHIMNFGPYSAVGALSFLDSDAHKGTAKAASSVSTIKVTQGDFAALRETAPDLADAVVVLLVKSLQDMASTLIIKHREREIMLRGHRK